MGSEGKGLQNAYISVMNDIHLAIANSSTNAGHTFFFRGKKYILKHLPVSGIIHKRCQIYLCAGSIIHPETLLKEIHQYDVDINRIAIHPNCAIISDDDIRFERDESSAATLLSSTQSGVGRALSRKINRSAKLAQDIPELKEMVRELSLSEYLDMGLTALMEIPQGFDLSLSGGFYPYCTSREISIGTALADAQLHPSYLGRVAVCIRTHPIRVGNITDDSGQEIGYSGPFYEDSKETSWRSLNVSPERTTVTQRIRRVATFSMTQYRRMLAQLKPDYVFLNFANYLKKEPLGDLLNELPEVTHIGFGPTIDKVYLNHGFL